MGVNIRAADGCPLCNRLVSHYIGLGIMGLSVLLGASACGPETPPSPAAGTPTSTPWIEPSPTPSPIPTLRPATIILAPTETPTPKQTSWIENPVISSLHPLELTQRGVQIILGSAIEAKDDINIRASMEIDSSIWDSSSGIGFSNDLWEGEDYRRVGIYFQRGSWYLAYRVGSKYPIYEKLPELTPGRAEIVINVSKDGQTVKVMKITPQGEEEITTRTLPTPLYDRTRRMVVEIQVGPAAVKTKGLAIFQTSSGEYQAPAESKLEKLAALANQLGIGLSVGTNPGRYPINLLEVQNILDTVFDKSIVPSSQLFWENVHPEPDFYEFSPADNFINYSKIAYILHLVVSNPPAPSWLVNNQYSREQLIEIMRDHIQTLLNHYRTRYPDKQRVTNVVNEAVWGYNGKTGFEEGLWYKTIGPEYIDLAFKFAKEADPEAILIYNEDSIETPGPQADFVYNLLRDLKKKGVPIDVVGMEFHVDAANPPRKETIIANMRRFAGLGLDIYVTELDVNLINLKGTKDQKLAAQAQIYKDIVEACIESGVCKHIIFGGLSDRPDDAWLDRAGGAESPTLFDENYKPKPAFFAIKETLEKAVSTKHK